VKEILEGIRSVQVAVCGDFALDAYWILDPRGSEVSVETGLHAQAVGEHYYTLGGASNIVANMLALKPAAVLTIGVIGEDIFGRELSRQLESQGADTSGFVVQREHFHTTTYAKRYLNDEELQRIDFGFFNERSAETDDKVLDTLETALRTFDAVVLNQQMPGSFSNESFIQEANALFQKYDDKIVILDSRHYGHRFSNVYRKTNDVEAARLNGVEAATTDVIGIQDTRAYATSLYNQSEKPVFVTRGSRGMLAVDAGGVHEVRGIELLGKLDPVGAGDTVTSALAVSLAAGVEPAEAAEFANFAAAVTVQKVFRTGTAAGEEIIAVSADPDYIYQPELAQDIRKAKYVKNTDIELCCAPHSIAVGRIKHMVFDHDGTISVLRQGWENIMEPVMVKAILGRQYESADENLYGEVRARVREYICKSTGVQTIVQMEYLVELVREFGVVPDDEVLDKHGYKRIYNDALMKMVNERIARFKSSRLNISDCTVKGAAEFLGTLKEKGVRLYLCSGTDIGDVIAEARILGYADLFDGGIYGAVDDVSKYSKRMVVNDIIAGNDLEGPELVVFGDGPVEMRECRRHGGIAVGIASDEVRRYGLNSEKRTRLIRAGAQIVVPDFSQADELLAFLFPGK